MRSLRCWSLSSPPGREAGSPTQTVVREGAGEGPREREEHRGETREETRGLRKEGGGRSRWIWPRESIATLVYN